MFVCEYVCTGVDRHEPQHANEYLRTTCRNGLFAFNIWVLKMKSRSAWRQEPVKDKATVRGRTGYKTFPKCRTSNCHLAPAQSFIPSSSSYPRFYILDVWENRVRHNRKGEPDRTKVTRRGTPCFLWLSVRPHSRVGNVHDTIPACSCGKVSFLLRRKAESLPWSHSQSIEQYSTSDFNKITCNKSQEMKT